MSNSSTQPSARTTVDAARHGLDQRNGYPAPPPKSAPEQERDEFVGHGDRHHEVIDASFDRAEAYERLGDFDRALEWLDRAGALCGELPPAYRVKRARWARAAARRPRAAASTWRDRGGGP